MTFVLKIKKFSFLELAGVVFHQIACRFAGTRLSRLGQILHLLPASSTVKRVETQR